MVAVDAPDLIVDLIIVVSTFSIGSIVVAIKLLKLNTETTFLTASGASICGAAAVLATEPVVGETDLRGIGHARLVIGRRLFHYHGNYFRHGR
uniref:Uncharacterized protein n=1 Tax=Candidatus Kentrum sp. LFY TaxID=2126342 RepID=A0A450X045_9GAMM|nr:MAG: Conserved hypothetical protein 698 [Candidatus Kentron sp. LFY]